MRLIKKFLITGLVFGQVIHSFAQIAEKNITIKPELPVQGENIQIDYRPANGIGLKEPVEAVIYLFRNYQWETDDLQLKRKDSTWTSTYKLPEDCGLFALRFIGDSLTDTNTGQGFIRFVWNKSGQNASGAYAGWGLMRSPDYGSLIPDYLDLSNVAISDTVTYYWISQEISYHRKEAASVLAFQYAKSLKKSEVNDAGNKIQRCLNYLEANLSEKNLLTAEAIYREVLGDANKADSIRLVNAKKFPEGAINRLNAYRRAMNEEDMETRNKMLHTFLSNFPKKPEDKLFNTENRISYDLIYQSFLLSEIVNNNYDTSYDFLPEFSLSGLFYIYYKIIEIPHRRKDKTDDFLYPYAKSIVNRILAKKDNKPDQYRFLSPKQWASEFERMLAKGVFISYVNLLRNTGHEDEALKFALRAQKVFNYTVADLNDDLCHLLFDAGDKEALNGVLQKSMYENQGSVYMIDLLKQSFIAQNGSEEGFSIYLNSFKKPESQGKMPERIEKDKREGKMPEWQMLDASGKKISSKDLVGKTYVLDFWASWCVPCKASFPGMKLAVERYQDASDVEFFFVNTEEYSANYKEMNAKYVTDHNYPFHLLFDNKAAGAKVNSEVFGRICKKFTISGIPQKIFVDQKGRVQFISVGYNGSFSELADDISIMIEETKKAGAN
jgi:thiol-disulfide isomerase/thioredoxin